MPVDRIRRYMDDDQDLPTDQQIRSLGQDETAIDVAKKFVETTIRKQPVACLVGGLILGVYLGCIVKRQ